MQWGPKRIQPFVSYVALVRFSPNQYICWAGIDWSISSRKPIRVGPGECQFFKCAVDLHATTDGTHSQRRSAPANGYWFRINQYAGRWASMHMRPSNVLYQSFSPRRHCGRTVKQTSSTAPAASAGRCHRSNRINSSLAARPGPAHRLPEDGPAFGCVRSRMFAADEVGRSHIDAYGSILPGTWAKYGALMYHGVESLHLSSNME